MTVWQYLHPFWRYCRWNVYCHRNPGGGTELRQCVNWQVFLGKMGAERRVLQMRFDRGRLSDGVCRGVELVWCLGGG